MNPFRPLHPTLKKCRCGQVGTRSQFHRHIEQVGVHYTKCGMSSGEFFANHGEVPCYNDDPSTELRDYTKELIRAAEYEKFLNSI